MEDNMEAQEAIEPESMGPVISKEIADFNFLISTLIEYYESKSGLRGELEEGEEWKKGTDHERIIIPKKLDDAVERAFMNQIKKFC